MFTEHPPPFMEDWASHLVYEMLLIFLDIMPPISERMVVAPCL